MSKCKGKGNPRLPVTFRNMWFYGIRTEGTSHFKGILRIIHRVLHNLTQNPVRKMLATQLVRIRASLANPQTQVLFITTRHIKFA